jgi:hypothetical protein
LGGCHQHHPAAGYQINCPITAAPQRRPGGDPKTNQKGEAMFALLLAPGLIIMAAFMWWSTKEE